ncbi:monocarboxylate transporter 10-like [Brachionus plicatilis]|uniref:Monocarboxylate transporter 10-like n=1 Tax=Brachionus plicatilis TaxID=10195 RepID=A0A3M7QKK3_BRAPC|nr:monocarboxylate transporter 10-like [Brachionus plicatilis]
MRHDSNKIFDADNQSKKIKVLESDLKDQPKQEEPEFVHRDGGWGWLVVLCTGYCFGILIGMCNNYALIYVELERVYIGTDNHVTYAGWIGSMSVGIQYIFCVFGSILIDLFTPLKIGLLGGIISTLSLFSCAFVEKLTVYFFTYGLLFGIGQSFLLASTLSILPHYFDKRLSLANGIMNLIGSIIIVILPIFTSIIINAYGLKTTFFFLTALNAVPIFLVMSFKSRLPKPKDLTLKKELKNSLGIDVLRKKMFVAWCFITFIGKFGYFIPILNIDHYAKLTFPDKPPVIVNVVFSTFAGIAGIAFGKLGDYTIKYFNHVHYHTFVYIAYGIVQIFIPFATDYTSFMIQIVILGIIDGILLAFIVPISVDLVGSSKLGNQAIGYYHISMSATSIAGPAVAGKIYEIYKSYDIAFYIGGITSLFAGLIMVILYLIIDHYENKKLKVNEQVKLNQINKIVGF